MAWHEEDIRRIFLAQPSAGLLITWAMPPPKSRLKPIVSWSIPALMIGAFLAWAFWPRPLAVETAEVKNGPYEQQVVEEGKTRARDIFKIYSPVTGNLQRVERKAGDRVEKGALLATVLWPRPWEVRSPISGSILKIHRESDGPIMRGDLILEVADSGSLEIVSEVLSEDAISIQPGAKTRIESSGACPPLEGKVRVVEPTAFTKVSALGIEEQRVNVIIDILSPHEQCPGLADGFRVHNFITTFRTEDALTVPTGALFRTGKDWSVFRVDRGRAYRTPVRISRRNPDEAMVESGLKAGDVLLVYPSDKVKEGTRVKPLPTGGEKLRQ